MSLIYLTDSGAPVISRTLRLLDRDLIKGLLLTPFLSPRLRDFTKSAGRARQDAQRCVDDVLAAGGHVLFDSQTYAVGYPGINRFTAYDAWQLWPGQRGDLSTDALRQGHVDRVVGAQTALGVDTLAPTVRLEQPTGQPADIAIDLAKRTHSYDQRTWLTVAGSPSFWAAGHALDAYVGKLAQLRPSGFVVVVARPNIGCPAPGVTAEEVEGLCRTVYSLGIRTQVIVSHGDLAALPAVAAGATGLGSGWDIRQRVLGGDAFQLATTFRRRGSRVMHRGLLAVLKRREAEALRARDPSLSSKLIPGQLPIGQNAEWEQHVEALAGLTDQISSPQSGESRANGLRQLYEAADADFRIVESSIRLEYGRQEWLDPVKGGFERYAIAEGW